MLDKREILRYDRQMMINDFGEDGQEKLRKSRVLIAGIGGLGSAAAYYLTAAGVGSLRIVDRDQDPKRILSLDRHDIGDRLPGQSAGEPSRIRSRDGR